jgi:hypothetical protein
MIVWNQGIHQRLITKIKIDEPINRFRQPRVAVGKNSDVIIKIKITNKHSEARKFS